MSHFQCAHNFKGHKEGSIPNIHHGKFLPGPSQTIGNQHPTFSSPTAKYCSYHKSIYHNTNECKAKKEVQDVKKNTADVQKKNLTIHPSSQRKLNHRILCIVLPTSVETTNDSYRYWSSGQLRFRRNSTSQNDRDHAYEQSRRARQRPKGRNSKKGQTEIYAPRVAKRI